jgi:hypothetical protein
MKQHTDFLQSKKLEILKSIENAAAITGYNEFEQEMFVAEQRKLLQLCNKGLDSIKTVEDLILQLED